MPESRSPSATPQPSAARYALPALIGGALLIGLAPIFVRLSDVGPTACAFWRVLLALPVLGLALLTRPARPPRRSPPGLGVLLLAGLFFAGDLAFWHQSLHRTSVANATLLSNLAPAFATLAGFLFFGERFRWAFVGGVALAIGGAALLVSGSLRLGGINVFGDLLGAVSAVFYAGYLIAVARARQRYGAVAVMFGSSLAASAALLPLTGLLGETLWPQSLHGWLILLGLALLSHAGGQGLIAWALAHLRPAFSATVLLVQPLAAALFAWLLLAEPLGPRQAAGGAAVLAGIIVCRLAMPAATPIKGGAA